MRWTGHGYSAGSVFGIPLLVSASALTLAPLLILLILLQASSSGGIVRGLIQLGLIVAAVLLHEVAQALTARRLGVPVQHIALTWFGGYAAFWVRPTRWREALIALAGPASNLAFAALLFAAMKLVPAPPNVMIDGVDLIVSRPEPSLLRSTLQSAAQINLVLGGFNLLPALPLDGGHILRALLAMRLSPGRAHWIAAWSGIVLGALLIAYAFWVESCWSLAIGIFITAIAWNERRRA